MRARRSFHGMLFTFACALVIPAVIAACKKPEPAVVDAGPEPVATDAAPAQLVPLDQLDAGDDADASDGAPKKHGGSGLSTNQARAKQCCNALKAMAGTDPFFAGIVAQCNTIAMQMGPSSGEAPEFAPIRMALKGKNMPAVCQGL